MRVLHLLPDFDPTGAAAQVDTLTRLLTPQVESRRVIVARRPRASRPGIESPIVLRGPADLHGWRQLRAAVAQWPPDVIQSWLPADDPAALCCMQLGKCRGIVAWRTEPTRDPSWIDRLAWNRSTTVVLPTRGLAARAQRWGVSAERQIILPDLIDEPTEGPLSWSSIEGEPRIILAAGQWLRRERADDLLWAFSLLFLIRDDVRGVILTHGQLDGPLRRFAHQADVAERVTWLPAEALPDLLPRAAVFCSPRGDAGLSPELLAAAACGVPLVVTATDDQRAFAATLPGTSLVPVRDRAALGRALLRGLDEPRSIERRGRFQNAAAIDGWRRLYGLGPRAAEPLSAR